MDATATPNVDLMNTDDIARLLGVKPLTVRWYLSHDPERVPPRVQWSSKPLWSRAVVSAWVAARDGSSELARRFAKPSASQSAGERPPRVVKRGRPRRVPA